jgi:hypothetical protein
MAPWHKTISAMLLDLPRHYRGEIQKEDLGGLPSPYRNGSLLANSSSVPAGQQGIRQNDLALHSGLRMVGAWPRRYRASSNGKVRRNGRGPAHVSTPWRACFTRSPAGAAYCRRKGRCCWRATRPSSVCCTSAARIPPACWTTCGLTSGYISRSSRKEQVEKEYILAALELNDGNQTRTAEQLRIGSATLYRKLRSDGMTGKKRMVVAGL